MNAKAFSRVLKNTISVDLEYRFNYVMIALSSVITIAMEWAIFSHVFANRDQVGGLEASSAFAFILYGMILRTVQALWGPIFTSIEEIREGAFRRYILQPIFHPTYFLAQALGNKVTPFIGAVVICIVYKSPLFSSPETFLALGNLPYSVLSFALSTLLLWAVCLMIVYASFFLDESSFLIVSLNIAASMLSGSQLPLSWYPEIVRKVLMWTPLPLWGDWPLRAALGLLSYDEQIRYLGLWALWAAIVFFFVVLFYKRGLKRYESFGG
ncbi:MAG: ABC-2 family transporter protein [Bdellovibrionota bacterium]